ncbi:MAG: hypothetical protein RBS57_08660, partial [Desulforhabdus sp.]|jgi:hypothetical protein|nr:hypothetical protein [Desulforhabdus sp.]
LLFGEPEAAPKNGNIVLQGFSSDLMKPLTAPEEFGSDNLSDKIDGKAELYLSAGFQNLKSQRLQKPDEADSWLEVFLFDMGNVRNAYSVYSLQRRPDAQTADFSQFAYQTGNALFFAHGRYYVEMIASREGMTETMLALARDFVQQEPVAPDSLGELAMFPVDRLVEGSISLHATDVFGFSRLNNVFTAKYEIADQEVRAFVSVRESPQSAAEMASAYHRFLLDNGAVEVEPGIAVPGARLLDVFDLYELIFSHGEFMAGVHEADDIDSARELGRMLYHKLRAAR